MIMMLDRCNLDRLRTRVRARFKRDRCRYCFSAREYRQPALKAIRCWQASNPQASRNLMALATPEAHASHESSAFPVIKLRAIGVVRVSQRGGRTDDEIHSFDTQAERIAAL